ncbi:PepSY-like domain-containing protein [Chryseobacterium polytrichastri]|uniref:Putative beta-lactamase-inhibitor-like, PepSY-like n=1 Tax=Chryseobacterium polytrichastri TaxID=1302687 RepID=A0A1M6YE46_9FLAO|nr:PepSY-like domain-containing protein [Chryseobacterium polytrichastri]SHL16403.1 Putative beta-lactamase-inhibitor-like, PepSY-like [Chryseobacterium polytrichastri]
MEKRNKITVVLALVLLLMMGFVYGQDRVISANQLPKTAKNFLFVNFKGIATSSVIEDNEIFGVDEYKILLTNGIKVEFDSKGSWKEVDGKHQKVPYGFIPAAIKNYVAKSFPNTYIVKIERKRWSYEAKLSNGIDLEFDKNGNFKRIDD